MIFVTVGTHEQQFNRLIKKIDELKEQGAIREPVFIQSGYRLQHGGRSVFITSVNRRHSTVCQWGLGISSIR